MNWSPDAIASIERATLDAVPPRIQEEFEGWLIGYDDGTVSRARSAVPLLHEAERTLGLERIATLYRAQDLTPCFRLPDTTGLVAVRDRLTDMGYVSRSPTLVQCASCATVRNAPNSALSVPESTNAPGGPQSVWGGVSLRLSPSPDEAWCSVFLGEGFDPVDGQSRTTVLRRARHARYARIEVDGQTVAVGMGSFSQGWASVHGMRTLPEFRGRGFAQAIVQVLVSEALEQNLTRVFLQVEQANTAAQRLYRRLGFTDQWTYRYWEPQTQGSDLAHKQFSDRSPDRSPDRSTDSSQVMIQRLEGSGT